MENNKKSNKLQIPFPFKKYSLNLIVYSGTNGIVKPSDKTPILRMQSVQNLRNLVYANKWLFSILEAGLRKIPAIVVEKYQDSDIIKMCQPRPSILHGKSVDEVMNILDIITQTPPKYENKQTAGVPYIAFLYDLIHSDDGQIFFADQDVNQCLRRIFDDYASMLKTKESLIFLNEDQNGWFSPQARQRVDYDEFVCDQSLPHYGFSSWNDWFTRVFREGKRPVDPNPNAIVNNCESYPLVNTETPVFNVKEQDQFWLKHSPYSLVDMFAVEQQQPEVLDIVRESFVGGTVYQGFLTPWCYHRWHAPVSGVIEKVYVIKGTIFIFNPSLDKDFKDCYDNSQPMLSVVSTRQIFIIKADNPKIGRVGIIEIGMAEVAGCHSLVKVGEHVNKGQMIGMFEFGGSSHVLVFDRKAKLQFSPSIKERIIDPKTGNKVALIQKVNSTLATVL